VLIGIRKTDGSPLSITLDGCGYVVREAVCYAPVMDSLHATIEEFAADGITHVDCHYPRGRMTRLRPISWLPRISMISVLALLCFCLVSWTAAAQEADMAPQGAQLTFQTLDGDTQQVNSGEIWRIRPTSTSDEPPGAIVIDYAFERVYVKESLASVVEKVGGVRPLKKFTLPAGGPVYIVATKVTGVTRAIPHLHHPNAHAIIVSREGQTQVQETREAINQALVK
jgi:hypothetical protein